MLIRPRSVCVSSEPDGCSRHMQSYQFGAHHITACPFFSLSLFLSTLSSSAELFLVVSSFCGSCKLSVYPQRQPSSYPGHCIQRHVATIRFQPFRLWPARMSYMSFPSVLHFFPQTTHLVFRMSPTKFAGRSVNKFTVHLFLFLYFRL